MDYPSKLGIKIVSGDKNTYKETVPPILGITEKKVSILDMDIKINGSFTIN